MTRSNDEGTSYAYVTDHKRRCVSCIVTAVTRLYSKSSRIQTERGG